MTSKFEKILAIYYIIPHKFPLLPRCPWQARSCRHCGYNHSPALHGLTDTVDQADVIEARVS